MADVQYHKRDNGAEYMTVSNIAPVNEYKAIEHELRSYHPVMQEPEHTGSAFQDGQMLKRNRCVWLTAIYQEEHRVVSGILRNTLNALHKMMDVVNEQELFRQSSPFSIFGSPFLYDTLLSAYYDGHYYRSHTDGCLLTFIWWASEPETQYEGGQLILKDYNLTFEPHSYTGVIIPSFYQHEVSPIRTDSEGPARYAVSSFLKGA